MFTGEEFDGIKAAYTADTEFDEMRAAYKEFVARRQKVRREGQPIRNSVAVALLRYKKKLILGYPSTQQIMGFFLDENPNLTMGEAKYYAQQVLSHCDVGNDAAAWGWARKALVAKD